MQTSVIVVGSGIAGTCAALSAAHALGDTGSVALTSKGPLFSGSSFFEGTWGLGLIGPDGAGDEDDLAETIMQVGCGAADPKLVRSFVAGIAPAVQQLEAWGIPLKQASKDAFYQREYIPCFDHKHRTWRGIERKPYVTAMGARLAESAVRVFEGWELLDIDPSTRTAVFYDACSGCFAQIGYGALVLCTGGAGSLFSRHLTRDDCRATVQGLAANIGCQLTNMAFMQFMPGIVSPVQDVVFNERTFRFKTLPRWVTEKLGGPEETEHLLDMRSGYGPFTCRLESCAIDLALHEAGPEGLALAPRLKGEAEPPEFVQTYQQWLQRATGIGPDDTLRVALYAHASNGGLRIDQQGRTSVPGIFAAGECTGGMHGADRLGGLSSPNGLVFGMRAGRNAAQFAQENAPLDTAADHPAWDYPAWTHLASPLVERVEAQLSRIVDESCMVVRKRTRVENALKQVDELRERLTESSTTIGDKLRIDTESASQPARAGSIPRASIALAASRTGRCNTAATSVVAATRTAQLRLMTAHAMISSILAQKESRGSHYWDEPE